MFISKSCSHSFIKARDSNDNAVLTSQKTAYKQASKGRKKWSRYITKSAALCNQIGSYFVTKAGKDLFILSLKSMVRPPCQR